MLNYQEKPANLIGGFSVDQNAEFKDGLKSTLESLRTQGFNGITDFQKIAESDIAFENYRNLLFDGVIADTVSESAYSTSALTAGDDYYGLHAAKLEQVVENAREMLVTEASSVGQLQPIQALTMPLMKKGYIKMAYKDAIQTVTADGPLINIGYERDFIKNKAGKKYYVPDIFYPENEDQLKEVLTSTVGKEVSSKFYPTDAAKTLPFQDLDILGESGGGLQFRDSLALDFCIDTVKIKVPCETSVDASGFIATDVSGLNIKPNLQTGSFGAKITAKSQKTGDTTVVTEYLTGLVDFYAGTVSVMSSGGSILKVKFGGHLSSSNNDIGTEIDRERHNEQVTIPEQERMNTGLTVEKIRDEKVLANIDVTVDTVSRLSDSLQQMKDTKMKFFLEKSYQNAKTGAVQLQKPMGYDIKFTEEIAFPMQPQGDYMLPESEWRTKQLKFYLERFMLTMAQKLRVDGMMFTFVANPTMCSYLEDVKWVVDENTKIGGVKLDYKFGIMTVSGVRIHVISTQKELFSKGFRVIAYPLTDQLITYRQYDYTFFIENNYRNSNTPLTPNIMVAQRYLNYEILPVQAEFYLKEVREGKTDGTTPYFPAANP